MFVKEDAPPATKDCEFCLSKVDPRATRCPNCTSVIAAAAGAGADPSLRSG
jgi:hypothetical protein